jgi:glycosyltransferase involved in cell wall biosynthesis
MPVRDAAAYLDAALRSILAQDLAELELLAVDDGSRDASPGVLARAAAADRRVRVLRAGGEGLVAALNHGLAQARAPLVARMDADDLAHPTRLSRQAAALARAPGAALVASAVRVVGPDGTPRRVAAPPATPEAIRLALIRHNPLAHPSVMLRRTAVLAIGGYRPAFRHAEDFDLWLRLAERHELLALPEPLLDYREHPAQVSARAVEQRAWSELAALAAAARRRRGEPDLCDGAAPADPALLRRLGLDDAAIAAGVLGRALGTAKAALSRGDAAAARQAIAVAGRQAGLRPRTRLHLLLLRLRALR